MTALLNILIALCSLATIVGALLLASRRTRRIGRNLAIISFAVGMASVMAVKVPADRAARSAGFENSYEQSTAAKRGISDPAEWAKAKAADELARKKADAAALKVKAATDRTVDEDKPHLVPYEDTTNIKYTQRMMAAMDAVRDRLRDADSARFQHVYLNGPTGVIVTCGEVNSKNGFGGYGGFEYFISNGGGVTVMRRDFASAKEFKDTWDKLCR